MSLARKSTFNWKKPTHLRKVAYVRHGNKKASLGELEPVLAWRQK
jgi:hypothetical protein